MPPSTATQVVAPLRLTTPTRYSVTPGAADQRAARLEDRPGRRETARPTTAASSRRVRPPGSAARARPARSGCPARRRGRGSPASSRARRARRRTRRVARPRRAPRPRRASCEPRWTCSPSNSSPAATRALARSRAASSGGTPNFDPRWPVMIFSCPPASIPGVIRSSTRFTPAATHRSTSPGSSITTSHASFSAAAAQLLVRLVVAVDDQCDGGIPAAFAYTQLAERRDVGADALLPEDPHDRRRSGTPSSRRRSSRPARPRRHDRAAARTVSSQYTYSGVPYSSASSTVEQPPIQSTPSRISAVSGKAGAVR